VKDVQKNFATYFPKLKGKKLELTGFVWFQGWNDMCNSEYAARHKELLKVFIEDVRKDLGSPKLPVVIDVMGQNAFGEASGNMKVIQDAQLAMEKVPAFKGNVKAVRTDVLADKAAEELYPKWKDNFEKWEQTGSDFGYHYKGSAIWFNRIGDASAKAMIELLEKK